MAFLTFSPQKMSSQLPTAKLNQLKGPACWRDLFTCEGDCWRNVKVKMAKIQQHQQRPRDIQQWNVLVPFSDEEKEEVPSLTKYSTGRSGQKAPTKSPRASEALLKEMCPLGFETADMLVVCWPLLTCTCNNNLTTLHME